MTRLQQEATNEDHTRVRANTEQLTDIAREMEEVDVATRKRLFFAICVLEMLAVRLSQRAFLFLTLFPIELNQLRQPHPTTNLEL